jgi:hypothetical protein
VLRIDRSRSYTGESPDVELTAHINSEGAFRLTVDTNEGVDYEDMRELLDTAEQYLDEHAAALYDRAEREMRAESRHGDAENWR